MMMQKMSFARTGEVKPSYRGDQILVHGKSNPRTGENTYPLRGHSWPVKGFRCAA